jgi:hypothetical protein
MRSNRCAEKMECWRGFALVNLTPPEANLGSHIETSYCFADQVCMRLDLSEEGLDLGGMVETLIGANMERPVGVTALSPVLAFVALSPRP